VPTFSADICKLAQAIIVRHAPAFETALDATLGNGHDTEFLLGHFARVYAFDIQEAAIARWRDRNLPGLTVIHDSHAHLHEHIHEPLDCAMYNLGYLPGSDKTIVTEPASTLPSIDCALALLKPGGLMTIAIYVGHDAGRREAEAVGAHLAELPPREYGVISHKLHNRSDKAPFLMVIEKARESTTRP